ncbi:hypothetical protein V6N11_066834 [Hibiscus sabdariffa]|uniref:Uncharacterized protein n=1 Tax=Hibiscus sabdariffa TaxID=183260 RepID=A0ABR2SP41_9ROSI
MASGILSRADLKTMKKCRIQSKECKDLTYESSFMQLHSQKTTTMVGYLLQSLQRNRFDSLFLSLDNPDSDRKLTPNFLDFLSEREPVKILATVDEALNSREVVPSPNPRYFTEKVAMLVLGSNPLRFKIVRLSDSMHYDGCHDRKRYHCEIFDSKSWEWSQSDDLILSYYEFFNNKPTVSACGGLHWLMYNMEQHNNNIVFLWI